MSSMLSRRRVLACAARLLLVVPALALAACDDDPSGPRAEPTFTRLLLRFEPATGGPPQQIEITRANAAVSGPLTVPPSGGTITARYLNFDGSEDAVIARRAQEYETRITPLTTQTATFTRQGAHALSVAVVNEGTTQARVELWDLAEQRAVLTATMRVDLP